MYDENIVLITNLKIMENNINYIAPLVLNFARYIILAGIPFLIFYKFYPQIFSKSKIQNRFAKNKDFMREILHSTQTIFVLVGVAILILQTAFGTYTKIYFTVSDYPLWWMPMSIILALIIHDTYFYWMHKIAHHPKIFKYIHLVHHKSTNPTPLTSYSFNFSEAILEALIGPIILILIPMHIGIVFLFTFIVFIFNVYGHLGYEIAPKWFRNSFLFEVMVTSTHHNLHHEKFKGNYGLYFRFWDRLMKTEHPEYVKRYDLIQEKRFKTNLKLKETPI